MYINVVRKGKRTAYKSDVGAEMRRRLNPLGEHPTHEEFYRRIGFTFGEDHHPADKDFDPSCNGWEKFLDQYIDPISTDADECRARLRKLLNSIEQFVKSIETSSVSYDVTVEI